MPGDRAAVQLSPAEAAIDTPIGEHVPEPALPAADAGLHPLEALQDAIRPALQRPPCLVMFSGGRDSSAVLAVAASLARREGLASPVAVTQRFPDFPGTQESRWQELVVEHLGLPDWERMSFGTELNLLGPPARRLLARHGLLSPTGGQTVLPILEAAGAGTVLTGLEGDGLLSGGSLSVPRDVLAGRVRPTPRRLLGVARGLAPSPLRRAVYLRRATFELPWVRPEPARWLRLAEADELAGEPLRWDRRVGWWARRRYVVVMQEVLALIAQATAADITHPLLDRRFLASLARWGGPLGRGGRTAVLDALFGRLLPPETIGRREKADFTAPWWSGEAQEFATSWSGTGLPSALVDPETLQGMWSRPEPDMRTGLLLQAAWLAVSSGGERQHPVNCRLE